MKKCQWHFDNEVKRSGESNDIENELLEPSIMEKAS